jgi:hypothetical protein
MVEGASRFVVRKEGLTAHAPYNALVAYRRPGRRGYWVNLLVEFAAPSFDRAWPPALWRGD